MRKWTILLAFGVAAASAYGVGVGVGGFYALSLPMGDVADSYDMCMMGFGAKMMLGVMPYLNVDVGFGYHMKYKGKWEGLRESIVPPVPGPVGPEELTEPADIDDYYLTTIPITFGVSYPMTFDSMGVYFGGGGAFVMEKFNAGDSWNGDVWKPPESYAQEAPEDLNKPGLYVGGGFKYAFTEKFALDVNPRWMMVLDAKEDDADTEDVDESTSNSMFVDILIGVDYSIM
jgi:opacity protein-like surface antigen